MNAPFTPLAESTRRRRALHSWRGLTLVETIIAIGILALVSMGGVASYYLLNRYAANLRNMSDARALCQERIEQVMTLPFRPSTAVVPLVPSADPVNTATRAILGPATSYTSAGAFTGGANYQSSTETIPVYAQSTGTAASNSANVTYTRTSTIAQAPLYSATAGTTSLYVVEFTVTVSYVYLGRSYATSMYTMRGPD